MSFCKKLLALACVVSLLCSCLLPVCAEENPEDTTEAYTETTDSTEEPETTEETAEPTETTETTEATEPEATEAEDSDSSKSSASPAKVKTVNGFPLYNQLDYPNKRFGSGTVATSGCGITSLAMVATYLTGHTYLPDELAGYFGGYGENNVQRMEYGAKQMRLPIHKADNIRQIFSAMKEGNIAILLMNHLSIFTETQHFIVLNGVTKDGKYMVADSYAPNYEKWDLKRGFEEGFSEKDLLLGYNGGWYFDVSAMPEEPFIYTEEKPDCEPRYPDVELTWDEQQLMAKIIWLEARGESREGQQAIAEIILNRLVSGKFGDSIHDVIYGEGQFRTTPFLKDADAWQAQYDAIDDALTGPNILPMNVYYFATYPENGRIWGKIGGHIFCYG